MPVSTKVNGVWRNLWSSQAMVNGVWRDLDSWSNVNGVWRENFQHHIEESEIIGFRLVYRFIDQVKHPDFPHLPVNKKIPYNFKLTGEHIGVMDMTTKGVLFQYFREGYPEEGVVVYRGDLYAYLLGERLVNVGMAISEVGKDARIPGNTPGITEFWSTNKLNKISININGYVLYDSSGYFMSGWNSLFSTNQFLDQSNYPDKGPHKNRFQLNSYNILPIGSRENTFDSAAYIGIARDMSSETNNMIGSYGDLDQTISSITVNGLPRPFVVEIYH